jgi:hypothetical protein
MTEFTKVNEGVKKALQRSSEEKGVPQKEKPG